MAGDANEIAGIIVEQDVGIQMRDGATLRCDVYRPAGGEPTPALVQRQPYNKNVAQTYVYAHPAWYARHGYAVIIQDSRGRYASDGEYYPLRLDAEDGYDTIEWCAAQPWCNGRVGSFGFSIPGVNQLLAASLRPPHLVTAMPGFYPGGMYEGFTHVGGTFGLAAVMDWAMILAAEEARRRGDLDLMDQVVAAAAGVGRWSPMTALKDIPFLVESDLMPFLGDYLRHPSFGDYWREWELAPRIAEVQVPCLHVSGWYDSFITQTMESYERFAEIGAAEHRLLVGPWYHIPWTQQVGAIDFGDDAKNFVDGYQIAWADAWLKGDRSKLDALPPVRLFVTGENRWRDYDAWPPPGISTVSWFLHSEGKANSLSGDGTLSRGAPGDEAPDFYIYSPDQPVQSAGGHSCCLPQNAPMGPADQRGVELRNDVLVYTSAPLDQPMFVAGPVTATLWAASSARDTDFTVKLCDVSPDGLSINLQEGVIRARYRESLERETPLEPNALYEFRINVGAVCHRFGKGHRIRVQIASSNYPAYDRNSNTGGPIGQESAFDLVAAHQTVFHSAAYPSRLEMPVVGG